AANGNATGRPRLRPPRSFPLLPPLLGRPATRVSQRRKTGSPFHPPACRRLPESLPRTAFSPAGYASLQI
ncbi:hypothetical protein, partial [Burkholderia ubonensis]|uniref:hypothetical protein n=1 Tax=Burkholderia ubonensis TaxID=101571 RepID=UPI001C4305BD